MTYTPNILAMSPLRFRASPHVELKQLAELSAEQRQPLLELERDPDFYGLLIPHPPLTVNLKAISRPTAELFRALATPAPVEPALVDDVVELVLDGILEVESDDGFVYGADAMPLLAPPEPPPDARDAVARLSRDALLHAQDLEAHDASALTTALYLYNRIPLSPFWQTRFATRETILAHLGADRGALRALLEREWTPSDSMRGWLSWQPRASSHRDPDRVTYKLYISPRPERMRDTFEVVVRVLADFPGTPFKIGHDAAGLLRPDKFVAYFPTRQELGDAADALRRELAGCDAHGVPFSAALDESGLLSWGVDPPENERALTWLGRDSWRFWIAKQLGGAMAIAKGARGADAIEPWRFAVERARRQGVDVERWTPAAALWHRE